MVGGLDGKGKEVRGKWWSPLREFLRRYEQFIA